MPKSACIELQLKLTDVDTIGESLRGEAPQC